MMSVRECDVARGAQPQVKSAAFRNLLLVALDSSGLLLGKFGSFRRHHEGLVVSEAIVRDSNENHAGDQHTQRHHACNKWQLSPQPNRHRSSSSYLFHRSSLFALCSLPFALTPKLPV